MEAEFNDYHAPLGHEKTAVKKRVLFIITQSEQGGAQQFLARFLNHSDRNQFEYGVVTGQDGKNEIASHLPSDISITIAKHLRRNPHLWSDLRSLLELRRMIRDFKPDILFLASSKAGFNGSLAARLMRHRLPNLKVIYRIGGWTFHDPWPAWKKRFYLILEKFSARWKDYIVVNNAHDLSSALTYHIRPRKKLLLIHNGIDPYLEFFSKEEARVRLLEKLSHIQVQKNMGGGAAFLKAEAVIGTIANFYPAKDLLTLIKAIALVPRDIVCVIIGDGYLRPELEAEISHLNLEHKVFLVGKLDQAHRYLPAFDSFILSSVKEGFPWAVLEAIAAKVPVIATDVGGISDILENQKSGLIVPPRKPELIAEAIKTILGNESLRQELTIQAHQELIRNFTLQIMTNRFEELFLAATTDSSR